ncbi:MAG TPA: diaminopimelate decarboxylase [Candidatus Limnocylindria bacterium]|nr:diaminopimelate decarboxylase [Candidatus Limnocylindria bacterium]
MNKDLPFTKEQVKALASRFPAPFHIYDETHIRERSQLLYKAMQNVGFKGFRNYFAVKALPNPHVMQILADEGQGMDCSSIAELDLADRIGLSGEDIFFSSNNTAMAEYERAVELEATINFDEISHIEPFLQKFGTPKVGCCRYNPGNMSFADAEEWIMGTPSEAKYGMTREQIIASYRMLKEAGVTTFGLHTMLLSNDRDWRNHARIARQLFELAVEIHQALGITFSFINLSGGIGVPYHPADQPFDVEALAMAVRQAYDELNLNLLGRPAIFMESGRFMTAEAGWLVTEVINMKRTHKTYVGVDASMANLMRPGMYGAYHHITVLGKEDQEPTDLVDVTGSLCENNDKFAIDRELPPIEVGDYLVIHTTGAHGHSMGFNYNGKLRSAELLMKENGEVEMIRRAETLNDLFATLEFPEMRIRL